MLSDFENCSDMIQIVEQGCSVILNSRKLQLSRRTNPTAVTLFMEMYWDTLHPMLSWREKDFWIWLWQEIQGLFIPKQTLEFWKLQVHTCYYLVPCIQRILLTKCIEIVGRGLYDCLDLGASHERIVTEPNAWRLLHPIVT